MRKCPQVRIKQTNKRTNKNTFHLNTSAVATLEIKRIPREGRRMCETLRQRACKTRVSQKRPRKDEGLTLESGQLPALLAPQ